MIVRPVWPKETAFTLTRALDGLVDSIQRAISPYSYYTPTIVQGGTIGNGSITGVYCKNGATVFLHVRMVIGSTTSLNSDTLKINAPLKGISGVWQTGVGGAWDSSTSLDTIIVGCVASGSTDMYFLITNAYVNNIVPFTWATNDSLNFSVTYIAGE